jgi:hypothetical protein
MLFKFLNGFDRFIILIRPNRIKTVPGNGWK